MKIIKAEIKERYISKNDHHLNIMDELVHETRYFSSLKKFQAWFDTIKESLWCDQEDKVNLVEGIFIVTNEIELDNMTPTSIDCKYAEFRPEVSFYYAKPTGSS